LAKKEQQMKQELSNLRFNQIKTQNTNSTNPRWLSAKHLLHVKWFSCCFSSPLSLFLP